MASGKKEGQMSEERQRARRESEIVWQIRSKLDLDDARAVLKMYNKLIGDKIFETLVGYTFLEELREIILADGLIEEDALERVPVQEKQDDGLDERRRLSFQKNKYQKLYEGQKLMNKKLKIALAAMVVILVGFVFINFKFEYSIFTYFTNYKANMEEELINKYNGWETELEQREEKLQGLEGRQDTGTSSQ